MPTFSPSILLTIVVLGSLRAGVAGADKVDFNHQIRPLISSKCFHCHGPDEESREAGLRLDLREEAIKEREGVRAIVPGDPAASELLIRITTKDRDEVMPPPKENHPLTAAEVELFRRWIAEGAEYQPHWSFVKPVRPAVPEAAGVWHPIDAFVRAKLSGSGLTPSPEADRPTLIRRLSLDLTGLPPTLEEIDAFVRDQRPDAYEQLVDRLLASPAYGERWAKMWMDLARYADSTGYGSDKFRLNVWPWRDWLIGAFNRNLPFDQFSIEQLAGDLLPDATREQIIATAFHRNTMTNVEGGTNDEEWRVAAVKDRIATTGQVWMGLTVGCAQCHTHKFDPITHHDYYRFFGVFNQTEDSDREDEEPKLPMPRPEELEKVEWFKTEIAGLETKRQAAVKAATAKQAEWEAEMAANDDARAGLPADIQAVLAISSGAREPKQRDQLAAHFRQSQKELATLENQLKAKRKEQSAFKPLALPILRELPPEKQRATHILLKGNYLSPGEKVEPGLIAEFAAQVPADTKIDRLAAARWLFAPENPLTARVTANRYWARLFGNGLVETEEDFGSQGALPSHPELLDWLAVTFQSPKSEDPAQPGLGWDMKGLLRLMVTSATYRQSSKVTPAMLEKDTRNRLLARAPRLRLEAEAVRDQALLLSGLLSKKIGGPSVYPPQPDGLWKVAFNGGQNAYPTSKGEDRYRRGLYTFWRRTMPPPSMTTFDAPSRESCTLRRQPTNTPLQAFVTMNDPAFVECSQALARRIVREGGADTDGRLRFALRLCTGRPADDAQVKALAALYESELATGRADTAAATKLATHPLGPLPDGADAANLAAWTVVANVLLNLDSVLTRN